MKNKTVVLLASFVVLTSFMVTGCSSLGVDPWDRDLLARPAMSLEGNPVESAFSDKMYFSREASSGGQGFAGGGCGCN
ncbi:MAG: DUF4266 domain-containing protein [Nitrospinota bacterium]|nr:DUF4266 domain-containing protein [Nitrospinota bacterium]MDH5756628.1 DUF4266 domain-containing protein [Nitrospinota bacterium]